MFQQNILINCEIRVNVFEICAMLKFAHSHKNENFKISSKTTVVDKKIYDKSL